MRLIFLLLYFLSSFSLYSQKTRKIIIYHEVDNDTITKADKNCFVKEKYYVFKNNRKIKHGQYMRLSKRSEVLEMGNYKNNKKVGVWISFKENGYVKEKYDFDNMTPLEPELLSREIFRYPIKYIIEKEDDSTKLKSGEVILDIEFNEKCELTKCELLKASYEEFNRVTLEGYKEYVRLVNIYHRENIECKLGIRRFRMVFGEID